ncbi:MAG: sulfite exporter TauE/SafE family protein [Caldisericia bacterium]|nr:sulfite exporter TauE/SafE family protein [Caldisericia bacterium]
MVIESLLQSIQSNPWIAPFTVFFTGFLTASNPCVLGMIPLMIGASGAYQGEDKSYWKAAKFSLLFVLGQSISFMVLGIIAALIGQQATLTGPWWTYFMAFLCILMGLMFADIVKFNIPVPKILTKPRTGLFGAFILGVLFGFVSTPCAVPILSVLLALIATGGNTYFGGLLLLCYALGHSALLLVAGISIGAAQAFINNRNLRTTSLVLRKVFGLLIIGFGFYLLYIA